MSDVTMTVTGLDQLKATMARMGNPAAFRSLVHGLGLIVETALKRYPPKSVARRAWVYGQTFQSDKQRRFFFWALRAGVIDVPYRRGQSPTSKNLLQSWTTEMRSDTSVAIGTQAPYAPLMQDATRQTKYAAAVGWRTVQEIAPTVQPELTNALNVGVAKILGV